MKPRKNAPAATVPHSVDSHFLKALVGYNTRRATIRIMAVFAERMGPLDLNEVEFSILSLIGRNPGLTPTQLCAELGLLPPNLTKLLARLDRRQLLDRQVPASDKRAVCLNLSRAGTELLAQAESTAVTLEAEASSALSARQRETLITLLQKIYA
ncbi:MAG: MarR family transcriptional regulator [Ideonella sp.]|nr:MarR family transcriptional regulator [Ideonella sp.]